MRLCGALIFTDLTDKKISGPKHRAPAHSHYENLSIIKTQLLFLLFCCLVVWLIVVLLFCCLVDCLVSYVIKSIKKTLKSQNNQS